MTTRLKMPLYTVILDYAGGTYVSQLTGSSEQEALQEWTAKLFKHLLAGYVSDEVAEVYRRGAHLVPLDGLNGVWCGSEDGAQGFALVNIVRTEP
jgi:hypothetical protein